MEGDIRLTPGSTGEFGTFNQANSSPDISEILQGFEMEEEKRKDLPQILSVCRPICLWLVDFPYPSRHPKGQMLLIASLATTPFQK